MLLARAGFKAIATTSAGVGYTGGYPMGEVMPLDEMLGDVKRMADRIATEMDVALSADMESGYGIAPEQIADRMTKTIAAGAVGINIEDTDHRQPKTLFDFELAVERIAVAWAAADATDIPFVLNARTDAYWHNGTGGGEAVHDAKLRRAEAFRAAGADCIFAPGPADRDVIARLAADIDAPLNVMGGAKSACGG